MTNKELIKSYIKGNTYQAKTSHLGFCGTHLVNYSTVLCKIDRENLCAIFNNRKYSATTSRIQSTLYSELTAAGYIIIEEEGRGAYAWNCGYQGARNIEYSDIRGAF